MVDEKGTQENVMVLPKGGLSILDEPEDLDTPIWRYMDFAKFVAMLEGGGLWLSRADRLGDPFEGSLPEADALLREALLRQHNISEDQISSISDLRRWTTQRTFINCWHMSEHESAAMWNLYAPKGKGIAVRSTYKKLRTELGENEAYIGCVKYIDYGTERMRDAGFFHSPYFHKWHSFEHEKELRVVAQELPMGDLGSHRGPSSKTGLWRRVDLARLINRVYVAPSPENWLRELVQNVLRRYSLPDISVRHSILGNEPSF